MGKARNKNGPLRQCFSNFFRAYQCHSTKHVHVPLSQYKTCTCTTATIQNMYMYHCHNTKHVHVPLSQYKTCTCTTTHSKYYCLLSGYWSSGVFRCRNLKFRSFCSSNSTPFDDIEVSYFYCNDEIVDLSWLHFINVFLCI